MSPRIVFHIPPSSDRLSSPLIYALLLRLSRPLCVDTRRDRPMYSTPTGFSVLLDCRRHGYDITDRPWTDRQAQLHSTYPGLAHSNDQYIDQQTNATFRLSGCASTTRAQSIFRRTNDSVCAVEHARCRFNGHAAPFVLLTPHPPRTTFFPCLSTTAIIQTCPSESRTSLPANRHIPQPANHPSVVGPPSILKSSSLPSHRELLEKAR